MSLFNLAHKARAHTRMNRRWRRRRLLPAHACRLVGQGRMTALMLASTNGHVDAVRVLIEKGALIEAANKVRIHTRMQPHMRAHKPSYTHTHAHTGLRTHNLV